MENKELSAMIRKSAEQTQANSKWSQPEVFDYDDIKDQQRMQELFESGQIQDTFDPVAQIAESEFEFKHPELKYNQTARKEYIKSVLDLGESYGKWVYMQNDLVRYPDPDTYRDLRTYRYRNLITEEEQAVLNEAKPAVFGMSVGGNIAATIARNGIGRAIALGDYDTLDVAGIGRNVTTMKDLTESKLDAVAKQISQIDPYLEQKHFSQGFNKDMQFELATFCPDALFDEVDHMPSSAAIREFCRSIRLPYFSAADVGDRAVIEVIRHDLGKRKLYASWWISDKKARALANGELSSEEEAKIFAKSLGLRNVLASPRLIESNYEIGNSLAGVSQLGTTALVAAGYVVKAYRNVLLGERQRAGIIPEKADKNLGQKVSFTEYQRALDAYWNSKKAA